MEANREEQAEFNLALTLYYSSSAVPEATGCFFLCVYCERKFYNSQALGGHQNAHQEERSLAKRRRDMAAATHAHAASTTAAAAPAQDTARIGDRAGVFHADKKVRMETQQAAAPVPGIEHSRSSPEYGGERTDGLDLSLTLKL